MLSFRGRKPLYCSKNGWNWTNQQQFEEQLQSVLFACCVGVQRARTRSKTECHLDDKHPWPVGWLQGFPYVKVIEVDI